MNKPHKHAEWIKAKADGFQIQYEYPMNFWQDMKEEDWEFTSDLKFRVKPAAPKWPETTMTYEQLVSKYFNGGPVSNAQEYLAWRRIANAALAHALETGAVVLP